MEFLNILVYSNISFYIYKLHAGEALILHNTSKHINYIIIEGNLLLTKHFINKKIISMRLLGTKDIIIPDFSKISIVNYFYQVYAISSTYLFSYSNFSTHKFFQKIVPTHNNLPNYLLDILVHRNVKQRLIQTFLIFTELHGIINKTKVEIHLHISYDLLSWMTGSNKNTISILMNTLITKELILYSKHKIIINNILDLILD